MCTSILGLFGEPEPDTDDLPTPNNIWYNLTTCSDQQVLGKIINIY